MCVCVCVLEIFENNKKFAQHQTNLHSMYIDTQQIMRFYVIVEHFFFYEPIFTTCVKKSRGKILPRGNIFIIEHKLASKRSSLVHNAYASAHNLHYSTKNSNNNNEITI